LAQLYLKMNEQPQQLSELDHFRYQLLLMNILSNFELAIDYHRDGLLNNQGLETYSQSISSLFDNPVVVEWWQSKGQELYSPELRQLVSKHINA
jgi:hypothetical protein